MNKRPLAVLSIFFIFGIVFARFLPPSIKLPYILVAALIFILLSFISCRRQGLSNLFLILSIGCFAAILYLNSNIFANNHISHFLKEVPLKTDIVGIIKGPALTRRPYFGKIHSTYLFEIEAIKDRDEWWAVKGRSHIKIQTEKDYNYGDRLLARGTIKKPRQNPGFNYREYLERQNIFAIINVKGHNITTLSHNYKTNPILRYIYLVREKIKAGLIEKMPIESNAFLRAILLGDRSELPKDIQTSFKNSGTMHILAISGLHVGIIGLVIMYLLRFLRAGRMFSYIFTILFLISFALLTLSRPSVVRATVMACIFLVGMLLGRRVDTYNSLGTAALFILVRNPKDLFNVGFQLSFFAVLSILFFVPRFMRLIKQDMNIYLKRFLCMPLAVSMSAWLGTFPLILYYFRIITPIAIIANVFIIPALFVLLIGGLAFVLLGWLPFVGTFIAGFNNLCAHAIFSLADFFSYAIDLTP